MIKKIFDELFYLNQIINILNLKMSGILKILFVVYADFESILAPVNNKISGNTLYYQKHKISSFCYYIKHNENMKDIGNKNFSHIIIKIIIQKEKKIMFHILNVQ